jgi:ATP-dependent DNA helicase PIF1
MESLNTKQREAVDAVLNGRNILITGPGGTGKSFTIKYITELLNENNKYYGLTATTGTASVLIGGQTINSYLGIGLGNGKVSDIIKNIITNKNIRERIVKLDVLIIDEISMLEDTLFEKISGILSTIRGQLIDENLADKPFGGIQMIFVGDFCQLPPVKGLYCFLSKVWEKLDIDIIVLEELVRQSRDQLFQKILSIVRKGKYTDNIITVLERLKDTQFTENIIPTKLYPVNIDVDKINNIEVLKLKDKGYKSCVYKATCSKGNEKAALNYNVELTENAQIIITRNIDISNGLVNGTRGIIKHLGSESVTIEDVNNNIHTINYYKDIMNKKTSYIMHMPIRTSYALSIHKSQGMTIDAVELDLGVNIFAHGQTYTALSRAKSLNSIKIINVDKNSFKINPYVKKFYSTILGK